MSLALIGVAICALLAVFGFQGRVTTVGIDLGTTFSVVGMNVNGKIIIINDKDNNVIFPSIVSYRPNGDISVGYNAMPYLISDPKNTIFNAKRFIGRSLVLDIVEYANHHPYTVDKLPVGASNFSEIGFVVASDKGTSRYISPEEVGAQVLKYLLKITSDFVGHKQVNKAVIAVPAKFNSNQRAATAMAYKLAGLKVVRVLEEPTAAAVAYNLHKNPTIHHILVYDFGGGTLDVSLLYVSKGSVQVYATDGDEMLGGSDLDMCVFDLLKNKIEKLSHQPLHTDNPNVMSKGSRTDLCEPASIRKKAEDIKKSLSSVDEVPFECLFTELTSRSEGLHSHSAGEQTSQAVQYEITDAGSVAAGKVSFLVSKSDFEVGCDHLFERGIIPIHRLLADLGMSKDDIDEIVLVGGTTRIPKVKSQLRELFGKELNDKIDPDVTVAYGAASIID